MQKEWIQIANKKNNVNFNSAKITGLGTDLMTAKSTEHSGSPLDHSTSGVSEPLQRSINLPSTVITPAFGAFSVSKSFGIFLTTMSFYNALSSKYSAINTLVKTLSGDPSGTKTNSVVKAEVQSIIAKRWPTK